ncbi:hypothetical protein GCM10011391_10850 [Pullulanibacillus camelliae]|uniref:Tetratricopeptide repeat protein n=1 Tax=Pullulanibacillus camelliae TaxID=1707096 RepID=A0A8J2YBP3_9BACL|nr:tetratricopeptide repeat protein [Pullulanibacillus camelliae]GGE33974.1 hypothetical protein GCM10011391_10850 [Pullulanibacillus camelliae]
MEPRTVNIQELKKLFEQWYKVRLQDIEELKEIKRQIDQCIKRTIFLNEEVSDEYVMICYGHAVITSDSSKIIDSLQNEIMENESRLKDQLKYYFLFFQASYCFDKYKFQEALELFKRAERYLYAVSWSAEEAEYNYKLAGLYYSLDKYLVSINCVNKARKLFQEVGNQMRRLAACDTIYGLNCCELRQYEEAEEHYYDALEYAQKTNYTLLIMQIYHNLGLMYAQQNMSAAAILWLSKAAKYGENHHKTYFLLCREHFKINHVKEGLEAFNKGVALCEASGSKADLQRFSMLYAFYCERDTEAFEKKYHEGIDFFIKEKLWHRVKEYSIELAHYYTHHSNYKKAVRYYELYIESEQNILEGEILK